MVLLRNIEMSLQILEKHTLCSHLFQINKKTDPSQQETHDGSRLTGERTLLFKVDGAFLEEAENNVTIDQQKPDVVNGKVSN